MGVSSLLLQLCCTNAEAPRRERYDVNSWARGEKHLRQQSPSLLSHHTGILVFGNFVISPPDGCNAHMEVTDLSFLKSLRKLILMILMRDVAHSDLYLKLCSFSAGCLNIPPKRITPLCAQALPRLTAAHIWKYPKESSQILPFVQTGSGCIEILSEISVLGLLIQHS